MQEKILIIDDEESIRILLKKILEQAGFGCAQAKDTAEARAYMRNDDFALLLCDIIMPGESGMAFIRDVMQEYQDIGVIMITGVNDADTAKEALDIGVYGYITKPFEPNEILIAVENAFKRRSLEIENRQHLENLEEKVRERTLKLQATIRLQEELQKELQESEEKYRTAIEHSNDGVCMLRAGNFLYTNKKFLEVFGYQQPDELTGKPMSAIVHPDDKIRVQDMISKREEGKPSPERYNYKGLRKNGEVVYIEVSQARTPYQGKPADLSFHRDITERFIAQEELRESEERMNTIMNVVQAGILIIDPCGHKVIYANDTAVKMIGVPREDITGRVCHQYICQAEVGKCPITDLGQGMDNSERKLLKGNGESVPVFKSTIPVVIKGREYLLGNFTDISALKEAEQKIRESHEELETLISAIPSILIRISTSGLIERWNNGAESVFGLTERDVIGKDLSELSIAWELDTLKNVIVTCAEKCEPIHVGDIAFVKLDGKKGYLGVTVNPILPCHKMKSSLLLMGTDITERRILEGQLVQAQKLESMGQLAAGIAHEINTPIQYIGDNTRFFQEAYGDIKEVLGSYGKLFEAVKGGFSTEQAVIGIENVSRNIDLGYLSEEIPVAVQQTLEGVDRVSKIVRSMKEFSHPAFNKKKSVNINSALESTITISRNEWKYVAEMEMDFEPSLPLVTCMPAELNQVFLNLIINAAHAIAEVVGDGSKKKGTIKISTRAKGDLVQIAISDTGAGIPKEIRSKIFDPFFTTKEVGKGTGQGLAISHSIIVEKHGGTIDFETRKGEGTTFYIRVPV
jgi:two-component system, NtrC family, sensor kinase